MKENTTNIPKAAIRKGGVEGAFWIHLVSKKEAFYKFKIYDDYNGELVLEANFIPKGDCTTLDNLAPTQLLEAIFEYDNHKTIIFTDIACQLILVPPVIDGRYKGTIEH
jgi:hypothetical protein